MSTTHTEAAALATVLELRDAGALFVINHSAGKDSQAQTIVIRRHVPDSQILLVHADLPEVDHAGLIEHIAATTEGLEMITATAVKTFFQMVEHRATVLREQGRYDTASPWPSPSIRQCTSDLKRGPITREVNAWLRRNNVDHAIIVNCIGIRAEESSARAKQPHLSTDDRWSLTPISPTGKIRKRTRQVTTWHPILDMKIGEVFATIADAGQDPHPAYAAGMSRLSCQFCIMGSKADTRTAATLNPELFARYVDTERRLGKTMMMPRRGQAPTYLEGFAGITVAEARAEHAVASVSTTSQTDAGESHEMVTDSQAVVLSYGMGVDSTAILLRWLTDPTSRDFDLDDLVVLTAQTGNEWAVSKRLVEAHLLPRLAADGVRFVEVARTGRNPSDGITVLQDSRAPEVLHVDGDYTLRAELAHAGTVPVQMSGRRLCSVKAKGQVLDAWIAANVDGPFRHVMGFNADEPVRVARDTSYSTETRRSEYPLVEWAWGRQACLDYLEDMVGEPWSKSACTFCPFAEGRCEAMYAGAPVEAADALMLEHVSLSLNPRVALYSRRSLRTRLEADGRHADAFALVDAELDALPWAVYRVRRVYSAVSLAARKVERISFGTRAEMELELRSRAAKAGDDLTDEGGIPRLFLSRKAETFPCLEDMLVAAPATADDKCNPSFAARLARVDVTTESRSTAPAQIEMYG